MINADKHGAQSASFAPEREYTLALPVGNIAVCEWGKEGCLPLLFLHGWLDNSASFNTLAQQMAGHFRCIAFDFPGHGASGHLGPHATYHFVDGVMAIRAVLKHLQIERCAIVGHSMGGALGLLYAGAFPAQVSHLLSIEAFGPLIRPADDSASEMAQACDDRLARIESRKRVMASVELALTVRAAAGDVASELLRPIVLRNLEAVSGGYKWRSDARLRLPSMLRMTAAQVSDFCTRISAPMLVIRARAGLSYVSKALAQHQHEIAQLRVIDLDGGHHIHLEQPQIVANAALNFLSDGRVPLAEFES